MKRCKKCILDENFPGISFDENGICNFCRDHPNKNEENKLRKKYEQKFVDLISEHKGKHVYDCVVAFSGGKDSSYTLYLLKEKYDLNVLALSYDNWFQSGTALDNIKRVVKSLNIDLLSVTPRYDVYKKIIRTVIDHDFYSIKNKQRASDICTTCISLIRFQCFQTAIEKHIPFIVFGMSPGQAPIVTSVVKTNPMMIQQMQNVVYNPLKEHVGDEVDSYFLRDHHFKKGFFPYSINPLAFVEYDEKKIINKIESFGWKNPKDTDPNSTNCLLNALANQVHIEKYGFHPYSYELAELVREGKLDRDEALEKLKKESNRDMINKISNKFGV